MLSNLFTHYAFDAWLAQTQERVMFERYCDDIIVHAASEGQAQFLHRRIAARLGRYGLHLHPEKTKIVYCYQEGRAPRPGAQVQFTFLGYTFGPRYARRADGGWKTGFLPAVSKDACKAMARTIRGWKLGRRTDLSFREVARMINRIVAGWINYYGRFYKSLLIKFLRARINPHLVKWTCRKHKRLHRAPAQARRRLRRVANVERGAAVMIGGCRGRRC